MDLNFAMTLIVMASMTRFMNLLLIVVSIHQKESFHKIFESKLDSFGSFVLDCLTTCILPSGEYPF
jgi:hypothetical protein